MIPVLNWKELEVLVENLPQPLKIERVFVPKRSGLPGGFQKNEWVLECRSLGSGKPLISHLVICARAQRPYFYFTSQPHLKPNPEATQSTMGLGLKKYLEGRTLTGSVVPARERTFALKFERKGEKPVLLAFHWIPAVAEILLLDPKDEILSRSRTTAKTAFAMPEGNPTRPDMAVGVEEVRNPEAWSKFVEKNLSEESKENRTRTLQAQLTAEIKKVRTQLADARKSLQKTENDQDWQKLGDTLKGELYLPASERTVKIDSSLTPAGWVEKFYQLAKRKKRKLVDIREKIETAQNKLEKLLNTKIEDLQETPTQKPASTIKRHWKGKIFQTTDGTLISVGRTLKENLELTFRIAKGNDVWLHVRGKPSAHLVIHLDRSKSPSLETLLDAAQLLLHFSGGNSWGKTEVDYTFKKFVKRIKNSDQVSYTQNKTLIVQPDPVRLKRVLATDLE